MHTQLAFIFAPQDLLLIFIVAIVIFGPKRLPELGESLGKSIKTFKDEIHGVKSMVSLEESHRTTPVVRPTTTVQATVLEEHPVAPQRLEQQ